ncbi:hypothetical protein [Paenibacillus tianjinensis]|uniref:Uncharacterized protein n=1 Tax=Paenibacillus tianjinensis TaxID=2810347 RepID=A0ABX7L8F7_9BACL|nr:hypothetical protein [Paenibacillus tianjinensis]QSF43561.1 hypothetical protein JRJ22_20075 [Paenibacillus tianjinensis]
MENFYTDNYGRVWGNKAIGDVSVITTANNEITISSGSHDYTFTIPEGTYNSMFVTGVSELVAAIKQTIQNNSFPIEVHFGGNHKDVKYNSLVFNLSDNSVIENISGTFFDTFFDSV